MGMGIPMGDSHGYGYGMGMGTVMNPHSISSVKGKAHPQWFKSY